MDDDGALTRLYTYMHAYLELPSNPMPKEAKQSVMYSRWAASELYDRLLLNASILPESVSGLQKRTTTEIVDEFIDEMEYYETMSDEYEPKQLFAVAGDEARRIAAYIC